MNNNIKQQLLNYFGKNLKIIFNNIDEKYFLFADEIRIRLNKSIIIKSHNKEYIAKYNNINYIPTLEDIRQTIEIMSDYSIYSFEQEIRNGFITLSGGFRVGLVGKIILNLDSSTSENYYIKTIKNISSINIRIAREVKGCAEKLVNNIYNLNNNFNNKKSIKSTIIISPPNCGKTTLLRDLIRIISDNGENVGLIDERSEIASTYKGISTLDVGSRTDILDRCPKPEGMVMLLRSMSPSVIAVDEIGSIKDIEAIEKVSNSGVKIICTIHAKNIDELKNKMELDYILNKKIFERFVVLNKINGICNIHSVYNKDFDKIKY